MCGVYMGVSLSRSERCVAELFLNCPEICARSEQVGGAAVAQRVRMGADNTVV